MIQFWLPVTPPKKTSQTKGNIVVKPGPTGKMRPFFFKPAAAASERLTWAWLVQPYRPLFPMIGPVSLTFVLVYPHLAKTAKRDRDRWIPKISKPDCTNVMKPFEDVLVDQGFMGDDQQVYRLELEKWHGPDAEVGIYVTIASGADDAQRRREAVCLTHAVRKVARTGGAGQGVDGDVRSQGTGDGLLGPA